MFSGRLLLTQIITITLFYLLSIGPLFAQTFRATSGNKEVLFTRPWNGNPDSGIHDRIVQLIDEAPANSEIHASFYTFTSSKIADALKNAKKRNVSVNLIIEKQNEGGDAAKIVKESGARLVVCKDGCLGTNLNHNKFIIFSQLKGEKKNVVVQTSSTTSNAAQFKHDDMIINYNGLRLYKVYKQYWTDLAAAAANGSRTAHYVNSEAEKLTKENNWGPETKAIFFPRKGEDSIIKVLDKIDRRTVAKVNKKTGAKSTSVQCYPGTEIMVAMSLFTDKQLSTDWPSNRIDLARSLAELSKQGCKVKVVLREQKMPNGQLTPGTKVLEELKNGGVKIHLFPTFNVSGKLWATIHSKFLLISGRYKGAKRTLVFTGSHNYIPTSQRSNDEALLEIEDRKIFNAYKSQLKHLAKKGDAIKNAKGIPFTFNPDAPLTGPYLDDAKEE